MEDLKAIEILDHLKHVLFRDYKVWSGYTKKDFTEAMEELMLKEPKACYDCRYFGGFEEKGRYFETCSIVGICEDKREEEFKDFYCSKFEKKD